MSRSNGSGGLIKGIAELALALALLLLVLHLAYWVWVNYWDWIVAGAAVIGGTLLFIRWLRFRSGGW